MKFIASVLFVAISLATVGFAADAKAVQRPHYGGILRVEFRAPSPSLDPRSWKIGSPSFGTDEKLASLIFDRLVTLDRYGRFQAGLATEWSHDANFKRWQFTLRPGMKFSDGSTLLASDVTAALQPLLPATQQISGAGNLVVIQSNLPAPDLLEQLASGRNFIYRAQTDGSLLGTGPFCLADGTVHSKEIAGTTSASSEVRASRMRFVANEDAWSGRPFLNEIDVTFGIPPLRQILDLQLGHADIIELSPELVRRASQENIRIWVSAPVTLLALRFDKAQLASSNEKLREALSLSLDRGTMAGVLLQKQAEPASALLPQWLSGYAFLFGMEMNLERAKEIRGTLPGNVATVSEPLLLRVDAPGDLAKLLGERVAVNARQAQILLQVVNRTLNRAAANSAGASSSEPEAGLHLIAWRYSSLSPRFEMDAFVRYNASLEAADGNSSADPEQVYAREKQILEDRRIVPLVALPEFVGLAANVRDWMPSKWGEWQLADVWLDVPESSAQDSRQSTTPETQTKSAFPGAKP